MHQTANAAPYPAGFHNGAASFVWVFWQFCTVAVLALVAAFEAFRPISRTRQRRFPSRHSGTPAVSCGCFSLLGNARQIYSPPGLTCADSLREHAAKQRRVLFGLHLSRDCQSERLTLKIKRYSLWLSASSSQSAVSDTDWGAGISQGVRHTKSPQSIEITRQQEEPW